ncbi:nickel-dependent hydrogenases large subunit signature 1 [Lucifera butyrica]|uniref:Nickel-dependent hydrogenases large subunit signature 1 n=1 Tax=Lucifera butyrica TaxID=1351585 RepID=A0A498R6P7_9FIRM|nr:nickel-dependent hydrogenase large subunit [Lucifera butyrica]VBB05942.1 nickel-dependent hydrogenases large subunit signature 1 [Lucifera butyrica]
MTVKTIFPVTRVHEPLRVDVDVQGGKVVDAWVSSTLFRGFEAMMYGRDPRDAALFTQRICGICSSAHAIAGTLAQQEAFGVAAPSNGQLLTNLIFAADMIQNHLRHFYLLAFYDYVMGPDRPPFVPRQKGDYRLPKKVNDTLLAHGDTGIDMAMRAHEMMAVFGAKAPHQQTILPTGVTEMASTDRIMAYSGILKEITAWVEQTMLEDTMTIADHYRDYYDIGSGYGNLMSYGIFPAPVTGVRDFAPGLIINRGAVEALDVAQIAEDIRFSWYRQNGDSRPPVQGTTVPDREKEGAYSWVKAPRYHGQAVEGGPLARGWINGDYRRGISVMDRIVARTRETAKLCRLAAEWLEQLLPGAPTFTPYTPKTQGEGVGLTDAMRGALGHWLSVREGKVVHYQIVPPSTWNFSPRDGGGKRGPVEEALLGTPVADADSLIEVGRVVRSFDPCFSCAVHALTLPGAGNGRAAFPESRSV